jgi:hypothetical protein
MMQIHFDMKAELAERATTATEFVMVPLAQANPHYKLQVLSGWSISTIQGK